MSLDDDWQHLGATWRDGAALDPAPVVRKLRRLRVRTLSMVGLELVASVLCSVELIRLAIHPTPGHGSAWAWAMLGGVWVFQALLIYLRRAPWRRPTLSPGALLDHTVARARAAIRLAWLNLVVMIGFALVGLGLAILRWPEPAARRPIVIAASLGLGYIVAFSLGARWYLRRQRRAIAAAQQLASELAEPAPDGARG